MNNRLVALEWVGRKDIMKKFKEINGVTVYQHNNEWWCNFTDYIEARNKQGRKWSEKSFCDWCDKYNLVPNG